MAKPFISRHDVVQRLNSTLCWYKGEPVFVTCRQDEMPKSSNEITVTRLRTGRHKKITVGEDDFCYKARRLGYMNHHGEALWLVRRPTRQYKVGIPTETVYYVRHESIQERKLGSAACRSPEMHKALMCEYPSLGEAREYLDGSISVAIARDFAVSPMGNPRRIGFYFRGRSVGIINERNEAELYDGPDTSYLRGLILRDSKMGVNV